MPLPQQVVEKLSREPIKTPGWSGGILVYAGGLLAVAVAIYIGLVFIYKPILQGQISSTQNQIATLSKQISPSDEQKLATYYSQIANLRSILQGHVLFSPFLTWLEQHTEANVSFNNLNYAIGNQITLTGLARTQADAYQQAAIFQAAPEVRTVGISSLSLNISDNTWQFSISLLMQSSVFAWQTIASTTTTTISTTTTTQ